MSIWTPTGVTVINMDTLDVAWTGKRVDAANKRADRLGPRWIVVKTSDTRYARAVAAARRVYLDTLAVPA